MITGTFSIVRQSIALGCFPRVTVKHTSAGVEGAQGPTLRAGGCCYAAQLCMHMRDPRLPSQSASAVRGTPVFIFEPKSMSNHRLRTCLNQAYGCAVVFLWL